MNEIPRAELLAWTEVLSTADLGFFPGCTTPTTPILKDLVQRVAEAHKNIAMDDDLSRHLQNLNNDNAEKARESVGSIIRIHTQKKIQKQKEHVEAWKKEYPKFMESLPRVLEKIRDGDYGLGCKDDLKSKKRITYEYVNFLLVSVFLRWQFNLKAVEQPELFNGKIEEGIVYEPKNYKFFFKKAANTWSEGERKSISEILEKMKKPDEEMFEVFGTLIAEHNNSSPSPQPSSQPSRFAKLEKKDPRNKTLFTFSPHAVAKQGGNAANANAKETSPKHNIESSNDSPSGVLYDPSPI